MAAPAIVIDFDRAGGPSGRPAARADLDRLYAHPAPDRGWVRTNFVSSLDGSAVGDDGRSGTINTESDHHVFATLRTHADAILVGASTVRIEGYRAVDLQPWQRSLRSELGLAPFPTLAVITASLRIDPAIATAAGNHGDVMIITTDDHDEQALAPFREAGITVAAFPGSDVPITEAIAHLVGSGHRRILSEGGAGLNHRLLAAGLVDDVCLTLSARMVGGDGGRTVTGPPLAPNPTFALAHLLHADDGALFTRYLTSRRSRDDDR